MIHTFIKLTYAILAVVAASFIIEIFNQNYSAMFADFTAFLGWYQVLRYEKDALSRIEKVDPYDPMKSPTTI